MQILPICHISSLALAKSLGKVGEQQLDRSISPLKKVFIIKQILIKSGLVFNPTSGLRPLGCGGLGEIGAGGH